MHQLQVSAHALHLPAHSGYKCFITPNLMAFEKGKGNSAVLIEPAGGSLLPDAAAVQEAFTANPSQLLVIGYSNDKSRRVGLPGGMPVYGRDWLKMVLLRQSLKQIKDCMFRVPN